MADYCHQCSLAIFGHDFRDLADSTLKPPPPGMGYGPVICEGCGPTLVDHEGKCLTDCLEHHNPTYEGKQS